MKIKNEKAISLRLPLDLYQKYVELALAKSNKEQRIINISEIIRDVLNKNV